MTQKPREQRNEEETHMPDALTLIREDHRRVQDLFKEFENTGDRNRKKQIVQQCLQELQVHATIEEEILYPAIRKHTDAGELMNEAEEEHHVADLLMEEIAGMQPSNKNYDAKFMVLAENVRHHIREEEGEMLPKAAELGRERLQQLGMELEQRKMELMEQGRRPAATRGRAGSRNGGRGRAGRTTRTSARASTAGRKSSARGTRTTSAKKAAARGRTTTSRSRPAAARSRSSGRSRARSGQPARSGARKTASRARR
jgi:hemerythrin superfamily protein